MDLGGVLRLSLQANQEARVTGETLLKQAHDSPGFASELAKFAVDASKPHGERQLAALTLGRLVKTNWMQDENLAGQMVSPAEKAVVRNVLVQGLADPDSKLRTAIGLVIANIADYEVPDEWPDLLPWLVNAINGPHGNPHLIQGAVRCLHNFIADLACSDALQVFPVLVPPLLSMIQGQSGAPLDVTRGAMAILAGLLESCGPQSFSSGDKEAEKVTALIHAYIPQMLHVIASALERPVSIADLPVIGAQVEALSLFRLLSTSYRDQVSAEQTSTLRVGQALRNQLASCLPHFQRGVVESDEDLPEEVDPGNSVLNFNTLVYSLLEMASNILSVTKLRQILRSCQADLLHLAFTYLQIPASVEETWIIDPDEYIDAEDETTSSVRDAAETLISDLLQMKWDLGPALKAAVERCWHDATTLKDAGNQNWWKLREAVMFGLGCSLGTNLSSALADVGLDTRRFVDALVQGELQNDSLPLLKGRALWFLGRPGVVMNESQTLVCLQVCAASLSQRLAMPIVIGACRALTSVATKPQCFRNGPLAPFVPLLHQMYSGFSALLVDPEYLPMAHVLLDTLPYLIRADTASAAAFEPQIGRAILELWSQHPGDPHLSSYAVDAVRSLAAVPGARASLQNTAIPALARIASQPECDSELVAGAVDVACAILMPCTPEEAQRVHAVMTPPIMALLQTSDEDSILQECSDYVRVLIDIGGPDVLSWGGADPKGSLQALMNGMMRLLQPTLSDSACLLVGHAIFTMLLMMPDAMQSYIPTLLAAVIERLAKAKYNMTISGLIMVVAQIGRTNTRELLDFLAALPAPAAPVPTGESKSAIEFVLSCWTDWQVELQGYYAILVSISGLAAVLASAHPSLQNVMLKGRRINLNGGIRTRSKAASMPECYERIPADAKIFSLLIDALEEALVGGGRLRNSPSDADDDSEWEEASPDKVQSTYSPGGMQLTVAELGKLSEAEAAHVATPRMPGISQVPSNDPLADVDMVQFLREQLRHLGRTQPERVQSWVQTLTPGQRQTLARCNE